jgi:DNA-binding LytR/AlgR family response regulator
MRAIIVDDEPKAIQLLSGYLQHFEQFELAGTFRNGIKAMEFLQKEQIDVVFLDISMPHISGISLAKVIHSETQIVFTTAHAEFALESYDVYAVDYLLKPISFERFSEAIFKVMKRQVSPVQGEVILQVKSGNEWHRIMASDVLYLEKDGNYMTWHTLKGTILSRYTISEALEILPSGFIQIHKSFIISLAEVEAFQKESISIKGKRIPIGATFRDVVWQYFQP